MRLSQAIATGRVTVEKMERLVLSGCALGMAANAQGIAQDYAAIKATWPWLMRESSGCPLGCTVRSGAVGTNDGELLNIAHVFDSHVCGSRWMPVASQWTLDQLIDWVRVIEPPEATEAPETNVSLSPVEVPVSA